MANLTIKAATGTTGTNGYLSKNGNPTFVYRVLGTTNEQIDKFKAFKGSNYRSELEEVNGTVVEYPLIWSNQAYDDNTPVNQTLKGDFRVDNMAMLKAQAFAKQNPWLAQETAKMVVSMQDFGFKKRAVVVTDEQPIKEKSADLGTF